MFRSMEEHQISMEEMTSQDQILEFCESELFPEMLQNSEVESSSNCACYEEQSSYPKNTSTEPNHAAVVSNSTATPSSGPSTPTRFPASRNDNLSLLFDSTPDDQNDISASIDFTLSPSFSVPHIKLSSIGNQFPMDMLDVSTNYHDQYAPSHAPMAVPPPGYDEECGLSSSMPPSYLCSRPSCGLIDPMIGQYLSSSATPAFSAEHSGIFPSSGGGGLIMPRDLSHVQELDFQGESAGIFTPDALPRMFNYSNEFQPFSCESQHMAAMHGCANTTPLASEISSLEDPTFKVGKLSVEERKRKIHKYLKKRNERNFSKKIKYACRKTLADSRPRVRGRFAKNDELGDMGRATGNNLEDDTDEDVSLFSTQIPDHQRKGAEKEEDDMDSLDIFAHISGVNSFKCNYPIQSWI